MLDFPNAPTTGQGFQGYTWDGGKWTVSGTGGYLPTSGGTLTGPLILAADPALPLGASTKQYVDNNLSFGSITLPVIDGTATIGVSTRWAHADHVHPTDTSRYAATNPSGYQTAAQVTAVVPVAASTTPVMNGTAAVGVGTTWARADHVHASDTSRLATATAATTYLQLSGGTLTGALTLSGNGVSALHAATVQQLPTGSVSLPVMDGTAAIGVATTWAHADHVHASDSTRLGTTNNLSELTATASTARGNLGLTAIATLATAAQGSIVYMGASGPATIAPGTAGYTFQTNGPGANPTWVPSVAGAPLGSASPLMNGTATAGVAAFTSHEDHIHPVDTSRYAATNPSGFQTAAQVTAALPVASSTTPVMDGVAAVGTGTTWARADHVHASDTSRLSTANNLSELTASAATARSNIGLTAMAILANAAQGSIVYMGAGGPTTIAPSTAGYVLQTNGAAANPTWIPSVAGAPLGSASPLMNGVATVGVSAFTSHDDHVHPVDTSRAPLVNTSLTGVTTTQALSVGSNSTANPSFTINGTASTRQITFQSVGLTRWRLTTNNTAEGGSDAGSDFNIIRYSDGGASLGIALGITRSSGNVTVGTTLTVTSTIAAAGINSTGAINTTGGANIVSNGSLTAQSNILSAAAVFGTTGCFADGTTNFGLFTSGNKRCLLYSGASGYQDTLDTTTGIREWISFDGIGVQMRLAFSGDLTILGSTATKTGGGSWSAPSDARIKDVLDSYDAGLDAICKLHPVRYRYKHNTDEPGVEQHRVNTDLYYIGLIAQEAEVAMPELVTETGGWIDGVLVDDLRVLDPSAITFALINAVRELSARVVALEGAAHATSA